MCQFIMITATLHGITLNERVYNDQSSLLDVQLLPPPVLRYSRRFDDLDNRQGNTNVVYHG